MMSVKKWLIVFLIYCLLLIVERVSFGISLGIVWILAIIWFREEINRVPVLFGAGLVRDLFFSQPLGVSSLVIILVVAVTFVLKWKFESSELFLLGLASCVISIFLDITHPNTAINWWQAIGAGVLAMVVSLVFNRFSRHKDGIHVKFSIDT